MQRKRGFTLIEILVVITILLILTMIVVAAFRGNEAQKVRDGGRVAQSVLLGARDRALHAKEPRGLRIVRDPLNQNLGTGFVYVMPTEVLKFAPIRVEQLDLLDATGAVGVDATADTIRVHIFNNPGLDYLDSQGYFSTPKQLRFPAKTGTWRVWSNLRQVGSTTEWTVDCLTTPNNDIGTVMTQSDADSSVEFRMFNEALPNAAPMSLPSGVVIDIANSSARAGNDIMFSPRGSVTGIVVAGGPIYILLRDVRDVLEGIDPKNTTAGTIHRDGIVVALFPATGHVQNYPVDRTDVNVDGTADDIFRFAKLGSAAGG